MTALITPAYYPDSTPTTAAYSNFVAAYCAALTDVGFPRTADTGQFDLAAMPAWTSLGNSAGTGIYEVRYLNDDLHSTFPVYMKIAWYRSSSTPTYLRPSFTIGLGTDGAGGLSNTATFAPSNSPTGGYCSIGSVAGPGYAGVFPDLRAAVNVEASSTGFFITRTTDASGQPTSEGVMVYFRDSSTSAYMRRFRNLTGTWVAPTRPDYTFVPGARTNSHDPGQTFNVYRHLFSVSQDMRVSPFAVGVHLSEIGAGVTFAAEPVAGQNRTYMRIPWAYASANALTTTGMAVIWE